MQKNVSVKIYIVWVLSVYAYDMDIYLGKNRVPVTTGVTITCAAITQLARKVEGHGHK